MSDRASTMSSNTSADTVAIQPALVREHIDRAARGLRDIQADVFFCSAIQTCLLSPVCRLRRRIA